MSQIADVFFSSSMLPIRCEKLYTPPSSPASSAVFPDSSSPPSSPSAEPLLLNFEHDSEQDLPVTRVIDPFAGSYRAKRMFPSLSQDSPNKKPRHSESYCRVPELDDEISIANSDASSLKSPMDQDASVWEEAVERAFNTGLRSIDLSSRHLSSIPPSCISDLNKVVVLPGIGETFDDMRILPSIRPAERRRAFTRAQTAPASSGIEWGIAMRQKNASSSHVLSGASREHIDLYLGNNRITKLPTDLFNLHDLRILSLRNNYITYLPPEVAKLENLVDLNIALNKLRFLPSELGNMKNLSKLIVLPNPFLPEPLGATRVSETRQKMSSVPSLTELALRVLLTPPVFPSSKQTLLEEDGELPICTGPSYRPLSEPLRHILSTCAPGSVVPDHPILLPKTAIREGPHDPVTGIGRCPNPMHGRNTSVFVHHVEERFTWVDSIAGIRLGGLAPLRWRGCERGCLEFLNPTTITEEEEDEVIGEDEEIVHTVRFDTQVLDFDD